LGRKIEDCKLNNYGCRSRSAGAPATPVLAPRVAPYLFKIDSPEADLNIQYSIENIQYIRSSGKLSNNFILPLNAKKIQLSN
jgi:hypothetical protein